MTELHRVTVVMIAATAAGFCSGCTSGWPVRWPNPFTPSTYAARPEPRLPSPYDTATARAEPDTPTTPQRPGAGRPVSYAGVSTTEVAAEPLDAKTAPGPSREIDGTLIEPAQLVAVVGNQSIQAGDIDCIVDQMYSIMLNGKKLSDLPDAERQQFAAMREKMFRSYLQGEIQTKLVYLDFIRTIPDKSKVPEILKSVNAKFDQELEEWRLKIAKTPQEELGKRMAENPNLTRMALLMNQQNAESLGELERILRQHGSSLERELRSYAEFKISHEMRRRSAKSNLEITHEQMLEYYRSHHEDYAVTAKARWEQLSIYFDRCASRDEAWDRIAELGNAVYLGGANFAAVARKESHEALAEKGGVHDWISQGSLASKPLDKAIFSVPLSRLSEIIEDERGVHIVRVLQRTESGHQSFESTQESLREKIKNERFARDYTKYLERLPKITYIWTIFDGETGAGSALGD